MKLGIIPILHIDHECLYVSLIVQYSLRLLYFSIGSFIVAFLDGYDNFSLFNLFTVFTRRVFMILSMFECRFSQLIKFII